MHQKNFRYSFSLQQAISGVATYPYFNFMTRSSHAMSGFITTFTKNCDNFTYMKSTVVSFRIKRNRAAHFPIQIII